MNESAYLVYNPGSGKGKSERHAIEVKRRWESETGRAIILRPTKSLNDLYEAVEESTQYRYPIYMGGDGTLSECMDKLAQISGFKEIQHIPGFLPAGTGNSFLRDFGINSFQVALDALLEAVNTGSVFRVDAGILSYQQSAVPKRHIIINIWGIGLVADITDLAMKMRQLGSLNYSVATLVRILTHQPAQWQLRSNNNRVLKELLNFIVVSNSRFTGGAMEIAPQVRLNDGKLFMLKPAIPNRFKLLAAFPGIFKGDHVNHSQIESGLIENLEIKTDTEVPMLVDGEVIYGKDPRIEIAPLFWKLRMPASRFPQPAKAG